MPRARRPPLLGDRPDPAQLEPARLERQEVSPRKKDQLLLRMHVFNAEKEICKQAEVSILCLLSM
jgi:hypothetical protein